MNSSLTSVADGLNDVSGPSDTTTDHGSTKTPTNNSTYAGGPNV